MMPGPLLAYTISASARHGFWAAPLLVVGHAILELLLVLLLVLGLDRFINNDWVTSVIGMVGGILLVGMGGAMFRQGWRKASLPLETPSNVAENRKLVFAGILVSMSNPYWFLWWATIGVTYLLWALDLGFIGVASFFTGHILADLGWYALIAFIIATGRRAINDTVYSWLLKICGLALVGLGGYFVVAGIRFITD